VDSSFDDIRRQIAEVGAGLHSAGTFSARAFEGIARAASKRQIRSSVETGSGASTLLFSHLSRHHTVFAFDGGSGSIANVHRSSLLRRNVVTFVEGPTQVTLPQHRFTERLQLVLIDGPHGYPFPDLEYYFLYPHLETDALLILDDIHTPPSTIFFGFCGGMQCSNWMRSFKRRHSSHVRARQRLILSGTGGGNRTITQDRSCATTGATGSGSFCRCRRGEV
jgi:hypothetical protein